MNKIREKERRKIEAQKEYRAAKKRRKCCVIIVIIFVAIVFIILILWIIVERAKKNLIEQLSLGNIRLRNEVP